MSSPPVASLVRTALDEAIADAEVRADETGRAVMALDAGCGRISLLRAVPAAYRPAGRGRRPRAGRTAPPPRRVRAGRPVRAEPTPSTPGTFDVVLSSFTHRALRRAGCGPRERALVARPGRPRSWRRPLTAATRSWPPTWACRPAAPVDSSRWSSRPRPMRTRWSVPATTRARLRHALERGRFPRRPDDDRRAPGPGVGPHLADVRARVWPAT